MSASCHEAEHRGCGYRSSCIKSRYMAASRNVAQLSLAHAWNGVERRDVRVEESDDPVLDALGIDRDALIVYRLLRLHGNQSAEWLAQRADLSIERAYGAVSKLTNLALIRPSWDRPGEMFAIDPELGFSLLISRAQDELTQRRSRLQDCRSLVTTIIAEYELNVRIDRHETEILRGLDEIRSRLEGFAEECQEEMLCVQPSPVLLKECVDLPQPLIRKALRHGVKFRSVCRERIMGDDGSLEYLDGLLRLGGEIRTMPSVPLHLLIFDRRVAVVAKDIGGARSATVVRDAAAIHALCALFDVYWESALPVGHAGAPGPHGLTAAQLRVLAMLAKGAKDDSIAHGLGVSVRTVRRIVAEMMELLKASSRFEAGAKAVRLGWI